MTETTESTDVVQRDDAALEAEEARSRELARHPEELPMLPGEVHPHPSPRQYVLIAVVLVVVTALEVGVSYLEGSIPDNLIIVLLLVMAFVKFFLVAAWYMHLRTDKPMFWRMFVGGMVLASACYMTVLLSFSVFD